MRLRPRLIIIGAVSVAALVLSPVAAIAGDHGGHDDHGNHGNHHGDHRHHHGDDLLRSGLVGSTPLARGGAAIFGVNPGGVPWVVDKGSVRVRRDGRIDVRVEGLVIPPPDGTGVNPVPTITASLYCNATLADRTDPASPLSTAGDARIRADLTIPDKCVAPVVLLNPNGNPATYIAASG